MAKGKTMVEEQKIETPETPKVAALVTTELKQKQSVLNLDTMSDSDITLVYNKVAPNDKAPVADQVAAAQELVQPESKRAIALCAYATSQNYKAAKEKALASGNYMSAALRSQLTQLMGGIASFADQKAGENFEYWKGAYKDAANPDRQAKARKLLERAQSLLDTDEFADM